MTTIEAAAMTESVTGMGATEIAIVIEIESDDTAIGVGIG